MLGISYRTPLLFWVALAGTYGTSAVRAEPPARRGNSGTAGNKEVDLLRTFGTEIIVSSRVDNAVDKPEHLVDRKLATAWNSRTGDLSGAWVFVHLAEGAQVSSIRLTAGFTKKDGARDLFTMNHRISRILIRHNGQQITDRKLDVNSRSLQTIPIGRAGGIYLIRVAETIPGSKAKWRELCISELQFWGRPSPVFDVNTDEPTVKVSRSGVPPSEDLDAYEPPTTTPTGNFAWVVAAGLLLEREDYDSEWAVGSPTLLSKSLIPANGYTATRSVKLRLLPKKHRRWLNQKVRLFSSTAEICRGRITALESFVDLMPESVTDWEWRQGKLRGRELASAIWGHAQHRMLVARVQVDGSGSCPKALWGQLDEGLSPTPALPESADKDLEQLVRDAFRGLPSYKEKQKRYRQLFKKSEGGWEEGYVSVKVLKTVFDRRRVTLVLAAADVKHGNNSTYSWDDDADKDFWGHLWGLWEVMSKEGGQRMLVLRNQPLAKTGGGKNPASAIDVDGDGTAEIFFTEFFEAGGPALDGIMIKAVGYDYDTELQLFHEDRGCYQ